MRKRLFLILIVIALLISLIVACAPKPAPTTPSKPTTPTATEKPQVQWPKSITWSSRSDKDSNAIRIIAISAQWEKAIKIPCLLSVIGSTEAAIEKLATGDLDLGYIGYYDQWHASKGTGAYEGTKYELRQMFSTGPVYMDFYTVPRTGIETIEDFAGKKIAYSSQRALILNDISIPVLKYYGVFDKIIDMPNLPMAQRHSGIADGSVDVTIGAAMHMEQQWQTAPDAYFVPIGKDAGASAVKEYPFLKWGPIPTSWKGLTFPAGIGSMITTSGMCIRKDMPDDVVYNLLDIMYDNWSKLLPVHAAMNEWDLDKVVDAQMVIPYHPGAVKYFKEKGVWTPAAEARQNELMK